MCPTRDWFSAYKILSKMVVLMGNNTSCKIAGIGTIQIKKFIGVIRTLGNVSIVLILKRNMISLSILNSKGYQYTGKCEVLKNKKGLFVVMKWQKISNKLYVLLGSTIISKLSSLFFSCYFI